jgi:hypothetical protein
MEVKSSEGEEGKYCTHLPFLLEKKREFLILAASMVVQKYFHIVLISMDIV